ncbi:flagellar hook-basal body complex protein FliE [Rhodovulum sp. MB263]|uniref:flagellar hook-basal body complex protein FliE n=1 Tax=unclassified Rhodovulum TaxID=2631432 RepID=UPI0009B7E423|nr:flagellar hook-basal body complex protein FliE [Rhodovulum sp. MB263]ARC90102.1 flagellar hook-basal body protein FliE [Rhodovulum sp. MB263]
MDLKSNVAALGYTTARPATQPQPGEDGVEKTFAAAAQGLSDTIRNAEQTAMSSMTGGADPHALVQALAQTELAVETAVTIRDKVVEAYQEILRMPV